MWRIKRRKRVVRKRPTSVTKHYLEHKERTRAIVLDRIQYHNAHYGLQWNRVAIRNQRRCWGSCSSLKNLNFNYKIGFLPSHLQDYIVVHELCHLAELNHGPRFWALVAERIPDYQKHIAELRSIDRAGHSIQQLERVLSTGRTSFEK